MTVCQSKDRKKCYFKSGEGEEREGGREKGKCDRGGVQLDTLMPPQKRLESKCQTYKGLVLRDHIVKTFFFEQTERMETELTT